MHTDWDLTDIALWLVHIPREDREYSSFSAKSFETALAETDTCLKLDSLWPCAISTLVSRTPHPALPFWPSLYFPILKGLSRDWSFCARFEPDSWGESRVETYWTWRTLGLFWLILHGKRVLQVAAFTLYCREVCWNPFQGSPIGCFICKGLQTAAVDRRSEQPQDDLLRPFLKASAPRWFRAPQGRLTKEMAQVLQAGHGIRGWGVFVLWKN